MAVLRHPGSEAGEADMGKVDEKVVEPWPIWGRVLFWMIVVAVLAGSLVAALGEGRLNWASIRIVAAVVIVPGVALLVVALISGRSASRAFSRLERELADAAREVTTDEARAEAQRPSGASSLSLHAASTAIGEARDHLTAGDVDAAASSVGHLGDASSGWDPASPAAHAVASCRRTAATLVRSRDRAKRTTR